MMACPRDSSDRRTGAAVLFSWKIRLTHRLVAASGLLYCLLGTAKPDSRDQVSWCEENPRTHTVRITLCNGSGWSGELWKGVT